MKIGKKLMVLIKLSKSDQTEKSIIEITKEVFLKAKAKEEEYEKIREMLRIKYGIKESTSGD